MDFFITGASGYIGSEVARTLIARGHRVRGLARSPKATLLVQATGATPINGSLTDLEVLATEAARGDGVIHTAADPGPQRAWIDEAAVMAMLSAMDGGVFITTTGAPRARSSSIPVPEEDVAELGGPLDWLAEAEARVLKATSTRGVVVRPPIVYGDGGGPMAQLANQATTSGAMHIIDGGTNYWSTVHVRDLARGYALLAESDARGVFHAAEEPPVLMSDICTSIAKATKTPLKHLKLAEAIEQQGPMVAFLAMNAALSAQKLRRLGWRPVLGEAFGGLRGALAAGNVL